MDRVSAALVARCLRGRHVVLVGDSLTRYQYLNLAQLLEYSSWTPFHAGGGISEFEGTGAYSQLGGFFAGNIRAAARARNLRLLAPRQAR